MNKSTQKKLQAAVNVLETEVTPKLEELKGREGVLSDLAGKVADARSEIEAIREESQEKLDNMSDKAKEGDKGQELESEVSTLDSAVSDLESAENLLQEEGFEDMGTQEFDEKMTEIAESIGSALENLEQL
jgi:ATP-dependent protease HslVU (ClpYQ) peptidase subunit